MAFSKENTERLETLLELIEKNGDYQAFELSYPAVPYLKEIETIVNEHLENEPVLDKDTLTDSVAIMRYLAEAYDRLGRFAVSAKYYKKAIQLAAKLHSLFSEEINDSSGLVYNALKARNYYVDDDCDDIRAVALVFLGEDIVEDVFNTVMARRRNLKHDPVEMSEKYLSVIDEVEERIKNHRKVYGHGSCHEIWHLKKRYLSEYGIAWHSLADLNPRVHFD